MPTIFISYRREDSEFVVQHIHEELKKRFGQASVFLDVYSITPGDNFVKRLEEAVSQSDVLLAVIGENWLDAKYSEGPKKGQRRLDDPEDFVRIEINTALRLEIPVIPVLVGKIKASRVLKGLPSDLKRLETRNVTFLRSGRDLPRDLKSLAGAIRKISRLPPLSPEDLALPLGTVLVPKGLRSFDESDAGFFTRLLPGPFRENGLPESIDFWKRRIETMNPEESFRVGVLYGPSGCGKSSLAKAGLLPHLADHISAVYVESTQDDTEERLLAALQERCPDLAGPSNLQATLARKAEIPEGAKVCIVLDQFEQWLHATPEDAQDRLVEALKECDGEHLQCLLLIRDDFLTPLYRFMRRLGIVLREDRSAALVDLFDRRHAKKVLALLGQAYGGLPKAGDLSRQQDAFLNRAVSELAEGDRVISVRLALFAQMMKAKQWTPATLKAVGGTQGIGVAFLEDSVTTPNAPRAIRRQQTAAVKVLAALLPDPGTSIRGAMRPKKELLDQSGCRHRPENFEALMGLLDGELRLVTPTDPHCVNSGRDLQSEAETKYYQLTHDYLVPSLREWLALKQKETRRGRAEQRLVERAALWESKPENRRLPSLWETLNIRWFTDKKGWSESQGKMMRRARTYHTVRGLVLAALLFAAGYASYCTQVTLLRGLRTANPENVLSIVNELRPYRFLVRPWLEEMLASEPDRRARLHARLALVAEDENQVEPLLEALLGRDGSLGPPGTETAYIGVIRDGLKPRAAEITDSLWEVFEDSDVPVDQRFRAGLALAEYKPDSRRWKEENYEFLAKQLVAANLEHQPKLRGYLRPVSGALIEDLERLFREQPLSESQQIGTANALSDFAASDTARLAKLLCTATPVQYGILYNVVADPPDAVAQGVWKDLVTQPSTDALPEDEPVTLGKKRAGAAITLLRQGEREAILTSLRVNEDPEALTQFVHRCKARGVQSQELLECIKVADRLRESKTGEERRIEDRVLFGLLLALGEFPLEEIEKEASKRESLVRQVAEWYSLDPSSAIHGATGWLLRRWNKNTEADWVDHTAVPYDPKREWFTVEIKADVQPAPGNDLRDWEQPFHITFIVFPPNDKILMGSQESEADHQKDERLHQVALTHSIAVSDREIAWSQFYRFNHSSKKRQLVNEYTMPKKPVCRVSWFEAVDYCRWLTQEVGMLETEQCYDDPATLPTDDEGNPTVWPMPIHLERRGFRLLTEAEWEYACRSGTLTDYSFGGDRELLQEYAWFQGNAKNWSHTVGQLRPNLRGLFDMHGNLAEWCHDCYAPDYPDDGSDPVGPEKGLYRVHRGGDWLQPPDGLHRSAGRYFSIPRRPDPSMGLRICRLAE